MRTTTHPRQTEEELGSTAAAGSASAAAAEEEPGEAVHEGVAGAAGEEDGATGEGVRVSAEEEVECGGWVEAAGQVWAVPEEAVWEAAGGDRQFHLWWGTFFVLVVIKAKDLQVSSSASSIGW